MLVDGELSKGPLKLLPRQVQSIVVDLLLGVFKGLKQQIDLTQVTTKSVSGLRPDIKRDFSETYPDPSSMNMDLSGMISAIFKADSLRSWISSLVR
jgi:hypothetical protein